MLPSEWQLGPGGHLVHYAGVLELVAGRLRDKDGVAGEVVDAVGGEGGVEQREHHARLGATHLRTPAAREQAQGKALHASR